MHEVAVEAGVKIASTLFHTVYDELDAIGGIL